MQHVSVFQESAVIFPVEHVLTFLKAGWFQIRYEKTDLKLKIKKKGKLNANIVWFTHCVYHFTQRFYFNTKCKDKPKRVPQSKNQFQTNSTLPSTSSFSSSNFSHFSSRDTPVFDVSCPKVLSTAGHHLLIRSGSSLYHSPNGFHLDRFYHDFAFFLFFYKSHPSSLPPITEWIVQQHANIVPWIEIKITGKNTMKYKFHWKAIT